jgi:hypothetical protein
MTWRSRNYEVQKTYSFALIGLETLKHTKVTLEQAQAQTSQIQEDLKKKKRVIDLGSPIKKFSYTENVPVVKSTANVPLINNLPKKQRVGEFPLESPVEENRDAFQSYLRSTMEGGSSFGSPQDDSDKEWMEDQGLSFSDLKNLNAELDRRLKEDEDLDHIPDMESTSMR